MPRNRLRNEIPSELGDFSVDEAEIDIPPDLLERWQGVVDTFAEVANTPAGLIMKFDPPYFTSPLHGLQALPTASPARIEM